MGTSASSNGPGGGVPLVPPWVPALPAPAPVGPGSPLSPSVGGRDGTPGGSGTGIGTAGTGGGAGSGTTAAGTGDGAGGAGAGIGAGPATPQPAGDGNQTARAPARRFVGARGNAGKFAAGGGARYLRRALRHYVRKGYGGRASAVRRLGGTVSTAGSLYGALSAVAGGQSAGPGNALSPALLSGRSAREVMDAVVKAVRPADGTQDAEASRTSIKDALSELLTVDPDADLLNLTEEQRETVVERFVAIDVYQRAMLDIGKAIQQSAPTATVGLARLKEVKDYIKQTVAASFRKLRGRGQPLTAGRVNQVVRAALDETFKVFEEYRG